METLDSMSLWHFCISTSISLAFSYRLATFNCFKLMVRNQINFAVKYVLALDMSFECSHLSIVWDMPISYTSIFFLLLNPLSHKVLVKRKRDFTLVLPFFILWYSANTWAPALCQAHCQRWKTAPAFRELGREMETDRPFAHMFLFPLNNLMSWSEW